MWRQLQRALHRERDVSCAPKTLVHELPLHPAAPLCLQVPQAGLQPLPVRDAVHLRLMNVRQHAAQRAPQAACAHTRSAGGCNMQCTRQGSCTGRAARAAPTCGAEPARGLVQRQADGLKARNLLGLRTAGLCLLWPPLPGAWLQGRLLRRLLPAFACCWTTRGLRGRLLRPGPASGCVLSPRRGPGRSACRSRGSAAKAPRRRCRGRWQHCHRLQPAAPLQHKLHVAPQLQARHVHCTAGTAGFSGAQGSGVHSSGASACCMGTHPVYCAEASAAWKGARTGGPPRAGAPVPGARPDPARAVAGDAAGIGLASCAAARRQQPGGSQRAAVLQARSRARPTTSASACVHPSTR